MKTALAAIVSMIRDTILAKVDQTKKNTGAHVCTFFLACFNHILEGASYNDDDPGVFMLITFLKVLHTMMMILVFLS